MAESTKEATAEGAKVTTVAEGTDATAAPPAEPDTPALAWKKALVAAFETGMYSGNADIFTEDGVVQPPYAPPFPAKDFSGLILEYMKVMPEWGGVYKFVKENADGSVTVSSQQRFGTLQADLPALGPFPAVPLSEATERCKTIGTIYPFESMTFTFNDDASKIKTVIWDTAPDDATVKIDDMADCNVTDTPPHGGFGCLYAILMGKPLGPPPSLGPPPPEA